jgi:hypothetical protein
MPAIETNKSYFNDGYTPLWLFIKNLKLGVQPPQNRNINNSQ